MSDEKKAMVAARPVGLFRGICAGVVEEPWQSFKTGKSGVFRFMQVEIITPSGRKEIIHLLPRDESFKFPDIKIGDAIVWEQQVFLYSPDVYPVSIRPGLPASK